MVLHRGSASRNASATETIDMKQLALPTLALAGMLPLAVTADAAPRVVASILPVHSLVASVMEGVGEPSLIVEGAGSPHTYSLRPSQARDIEQAEIIFWIGHGLEAFLDKPLDSLGGKARVVELGEAEGLTKLPLREGGAFEAHEHEGEEHAAHDHDAAGHDHDEETDMHLWLDPRNAAAMVEAIAGALAEADPDNAARYQTNADAMLKKLTDLAAGISASLEPVRGRAFIVFHDAYHYFENRFGIEAAGSITVSPEVAPGAERVTQIRAKLSQANAACVFAEPQFEPKLISVVIEGTNARAGVLDPLGAELTPGPGLYPQLLRNLANAMRECLDHAS